MRKIITAKIFIISLLASNMASAESTNFATQSGNDIGLSLSAYRYQEPSVMSSKGAKIGADFRMTTAIQNDVFLRGELRSAFGTVDYTGSGNMSGQPDWYFETRGLLGKDWVFNESGLTAYAGLGYRYLFNDARGISCTATQCYLGYRRESNYVYLPVGIIHRGSF
jgi:hypothetical protein